ncbi:MAG: hypothetical protein ACOCZ8_05035 [Bacteroidota bacterium]
MLKHDILHLSSAEIAELAAKFRAVVDRDGIEAGFVFLRANKDIHMGHAMKVCMKAFGIGLRDAKRMIYSSPSWQREVESVQPLIDIFEEVLEEHTAKN